jgi:predicted ATP-grasp superfamily ATP-dependent carboligase
LVDAVNRAYHMSVDTTERQKKKKKLGVDLQELSDKSTEHNKIDSNMYM